jgi:hypothetical protein
MRDVTTAISKDFTALGNYASLVTKFPPVSSTPKAFETVSGILLTSTTLTGGPLALQILCGDGVWRPVGIAFTAQVVAYVFSVESFTSQTRGLIIYGARFSLAAALTGGTSVIYAELYGY